MMAVIASPQETRAIRTAQLAAAGCALAGFVLFQFFGNANQGYIGTRSLFYWWTFQWFNAASETQHGPLVLLLSAGLLWRNLRRIPPLPLAQNFSAAQLLRAAGLLAGGVILHAAGINAQQARLSILALLLFTSGIFWLAGGRRWGMASAFPLGFLTFAIPFDALDSAGFWLRLWVIRASAAIAHLLHLGVLQNGTQLTAPDGKFNYDVAAACSGVRSLMALLALALLIGYLNFRPSWLRASLLLLCVPLVYLGNVARISAIVICAAWGGQRLGELAHDVMGYGIFVIVLGGLLLAVSILRRHAPRAWLAESEIFPEVAANGSPAAFRVFRAGAPGILGAAIILLAIGESVAANRELRTKWRGDAGVRVTADGVNPVDLPPYLGIEWTGRPQEVTPAERAILPPDTGFSRRLYFNHRDPSRQVFFSVVLSGRDRSSIHRPELCLIGQGWTIRETQRGDFPSAVASAQNFPATILHVEHVQPGARGTVRVPQLVAYWFVGSRGTSAAGYWERLLRDGWNRLVHGRADRWAYILAQTNADDGDAAARERIRAVVAQILPELVIAAKPGSSPLGNDF